MNVVRDGAGDPPEARALRAELVRQIQRYPPWPVGSVWDPRVLSAIGEVPRHLFVPGARLADAYVDEPYPIGQHQTISQPTVVALMSQALLLSGTERVLEIGTGSGYQAAVLARLAKAVFSVERIASLAGPAAERLAALGYGNVQVSVADGFEGWPEQAPFDRILLTAAPSGVPPSLFGQLADGGICVAPVGDLYRQSLLRWQRRGGAAEVEELGPVRFVPMLGGTV
ncbi:MAG: protein-L-isoaspartate(D-aspartate) O-methyltransferase [Polyangiaceae bacterium]